MSNQLIGHSSWKQHRSPLSTITERVLQCSQLRGDRAGHIYHPSPYSGGGFANALAADLQAVALVSESVIVTSTQAVDPAVHFCWILSFLKSRMETRCIHLICDTAGVLCSVMCNDTNWYFRLPVSIMGINTKMCDSPTDRQ